MKYLWLILLLTAGFFCYSQSRFEVGFADGYKKGYCFNDPGCYPPYPPYPPYPTSNEKYDSYDDGYNRGFQMGLDARRASGGNSTYGSGSQIVPPAQWVDPIPTDILIKGAQYQEQIIEQRVAVVLQRTGKLYKIAAILRDNCKHPKQAESIVNEVDQLQKLNMPDFLDNTVWSNVCNLLDECERNANQYLANCN